MDPQDPNFRQVVEDAIGLRELWTRLGVPPDPRDWQPEDSKYVQSIFADKKELSKALGFENARCLTPEEAAHEAEDRSTKLFEYWTSLRNILDRFEAILRKRWTKKSQEQRKKILLDAWPNMSPQHRPDFRALRRESDEQRQAGTRFRDAYMWPYINLEDLSKGKTLLLLLNARGRHQPAVFASADLESVHVGQFSRALQGAFLTSHVMALHGNSPATYGKIVQAIEMDDIAKMVEGKSCNAGDGLDILEIQERLLGFLVTCCRIILQDKGANLTDESIPTFPEPPLLKSDDAEWRSAAAMSAEAPYVVPRQVDLARLKALISARLSNAEDHFWALREDPGYFADVVGDWSEHSSEMILDDCKKQHPHITDPLRKRRFWDRTVGNVVYSAYEEIFLWRAIQQQLGEFITLDPAFIETGFQYEEEHPEYLTTLRKLKLLLEKRLINFYLMMLMIQFPASPPIRGLFQRLPDPNGYHGYSVYPRYSNLGSSKDDLLWLYGQLIDPTAIQICGLENLAGELERLMRNDPRQKERVTPFVSRVFSDIGLVGELRNQLRIYRPRIFLTRGNKLLTAQEKDLEDWASNMIRPIWDLMRVLGEEGGNAYMRLGDDGDPTTRRFHYPVNKRRSKESHEAMRSAERHLDAFWAKFDQQLRSRIDSASYLLLQSMVPNDRQLQRTEDWVELENRRVQSTAHHRISDDMSKLHLELEKRTQDAAATEAPIAAKTKIKTRGIAQPPPPEHPQRVHEEHPHGLALDQQPIFVLKKRAFKVFSTLFHKPESQEQPGEVPWSDFLHAMVSTGFVPEKLYGSVWQFTPTRLDVERSIHFHEPHPHGKLPFRVARRYGRRLNRAYGWVGSIFVLG
jgi:hypothetical protein